MGLLVLPAPLNRAPKLSSACGATEFLHIGLYDGRDLSNILALQRRGGGWGQGLHLGAPRARMRASVEVEGMRRLRLIEGYPCLKELVTV